MESAYKLRRLRNAKRRPMWTPLDYAGLHATEATAQPMGLFGARVSLSYCLGLLTADDLAMLVLIKAIRNRFRSKKKALPAVNQLARSRCGSNSQARSAFPERHALPVARA